MTSLDHSTPAESRATAIFHTLTRLQNPFMKWLLRTPLHGIVSRWFMLITVTGRRSGRLYTTPVQYRRVGATIYVITNMRYTWWKNLRGAAPVTLQVRGRILTGMADVSSDPATVEAAIGQIYPGLSSQQRDQLSASAVAITIQLDA